MDYGPKEQVLWRMFGAVTVFYLFWDELIANSRDIFANFGFY